MFSIQIYAREIYVKQLTPTDTEETVNEKLAELSLQLKLLFIYYLFLI